MRLVNIYLGKDVIGGIQRVFVSQCRMFASAGHKVICICKPNTAIARTLVASETANCQLLYCPGVTGPAGLFHGLKLRRALPNLKPDLILIHGTRRQLARLTKGIAPRIVFLHNDNTKHIDKFDAAIALTEHYARSTAAHHTVPVFKIPNMLHRPMPEALPTLPQNDPPVIGAIGTLSHVKGFDILINALAQLQTRGHQFKARVAGQGPEGNALEELAATCGLTGLRFLGAIPTEEVDQFYRSLDILVIPSRKEAFGMISLEGMACGVPIIGSDVGGIAEVLGGGAGLLFEPENVDDLAEKIASLLLSRENRKTVRQHGFARLRDFSPETLLPVFEETFAEIRDGGGR